MLLAAEIELRARSLIKIWHFFCNLDFSIWERLLLLNILDLSFMHKYITQYIDITVRNMFVAIFILSLGCPYLITFRLFTVFFKIIFILGYSILMYCIYRLDETQKLKQQFLNEHRHVFFDVFICLIKGLASILFFIFCIISVKFLLPPSLFLSLIGQLIWILVIAAGVLLLPLMASLSIDVFIGVCLTVKFIYYFLKVMVQEDLKSLRNWQSFKSEWKKAFLRKNEYPEELCCCHIRWSLIRGYIRSFANVTSCEELQKLDSEFKLLIEREICRMKITKEYQIEQKFRVRESHPGLPLWKLDEIDQMIDKEKADFEVYSLSSPLP